MTHWGSQLGKKANSLKISMRMQLEVLFTSTLTILRDDVRSVVFSQVIPFTLKLIWSVKTRSELVNIMSFQIILLRTSIRADSKWVGNFFRNAYCCCCHHLQSTTNTSFHSKEAKSEDLFHSPNRCDEQNDRGQMRVISPHYRGNCEIIVVNRRCSHIFFHPLCFRINFFLLTRWWVEMLHLRASALHKRVTNDAKHGCRIRFIL